MSDHYRGDYQVDIQTLEVTGNPANAPSIKDLQHSINNRDKQSDIPRNHAEALQYRDLQQLMDWSYSVCSDDLVSNPESLGDHLHVAEHLLFRAYASTAFTLWTRYVQVLTLIKIALTLIFYCS